MNILEKYNNEFAYTGAAINIAMAVQFFMLWKQPDLEDATKIYSIAILMGFEFFMVHSGVFMAAMPKKVSLYVFVPIYGLFAWAINTMIPGNDILYLYLFIIFGRMRFAFSDVSEKIRAMTAFISVQNALAWFFLIAILGFNKERIPRLGLTDLYLEKANYLAIKKSGGLSDTPHLALSFAVIYYGFLALIEISTIRSFSKRDFKGKQIYKK